MPVDQKKEAGAKLNEVREAISGAIEVKQTALQNAKDAASVAGMDVSLPGRPSNGVGALHPLTRAPVSMSTSSGVIFRRADIRSVPPRRRRRDDAIDAAPAGSNRGAEVVNQGPGISQAANTS